MHAREITLALKLDSCINKRMIWFMVFNATFNNISVISWWSVLLMEETGVPGENKQPVASHSQTLLPIVSSTPCLSRIPTHNVSGDSH